MFNGNFTLILCCTFLGSMARVKNIARYDVADGSNAKSECAIESGQADAIASAAANADAINAASTGVDPESDHFEVGFADLFGEDAESGHEGELDSAGARDAELIGDDEAAGAIDQVESADGADAEENVEEDNREKSLPHTSKLGQTLATLGDIESF